ncbi:MULTISPECIES: NAD(P)/FAD-dependent oxidoreductase [unclassified Meiothermus]|uniref:phytoene desaturase family protein n=1 Tax=unclassified Meiothermus TaxID=370471 RepID=UPI000D7BD882|nr:MULTISPECIES: NAD(P)/FAD-dependent oxidoreductase [unclassified Meiothermus]PZA08825.1 FAD-dependent oxidoreductase [Meiothermus sp. Pnk-1]RYM36305.1 NAD(P)/FAD-dependent oxidoreductase [Meiothermus sp. PNK-Is4]
MKAVVIGAGFAGLAAALRLRLAGLEVTVLDKQEAPGGKAVGWNGGPTGPTVLTLPEVPWMIFQALGAEAPELRPVSPLTRYVWPDGRTFAPQRDLEATLVQLSREEAHRYRHLLEKARQLYEGVRTAFIQGPPPTLSAILGYGLRHGLAAHPLDPLPRLVASGPYLTPFFLRFATYLGANPYRAPAVLHNIAWVELGLGVYHLEGGMRALADALYRLALLRGVRFEFGVCVGGLELRKHQVVAARAKDARYFADVFVSAVDRHFTLGMLGWPVPPYELGTSAMALLMRLSEAQPLAHRIYFSADYRSEWRELEAGYLSQDPTLYLYTDGEAAFLLVNAPNLRRLKGVSLEEYARFLLRRLQAIHPLPVRDWKALSPHDYAFTAYQGALYGKAPHGLLGALRPGWRLGKLQNLVQVGGTAHPGGGVPLAMLSGWNGAAWLLRNGGEGR